MFNSSSERLVAVLREWIATAPAGSQLPSTRTLVADYEVSPVTVQKALRILTGQGIIESRPGIGTFVRSHPVARAHDHAWQTAALGVVQRPLPELASAQRATPNDVISLQSGYPDRDLLPERLVRSAFSRVARSDAVLQRTPAAGLPDLQSWFASELGAITAPGLSAPAASDVVVLPGSQSGLGSIFRSLVGAGKPMLIESPTYWGAILAAAQVGVQLVPVPAGPHGPDTGQLDRAFEQTGARAFYAHPNFANPSGAQWSPEVSQRVLEILKNRGAFLVEDDWAKDLGINAESSPMAARDDSGHVVYLRSLTKSVSRRSVLPASLPEGQHGNGSWPITRPNPCMSVVRCNPSRLTWSPSPGGAPTCARCASSWQRAGIWCSTPWRSICPKHMSSRSRWAG